MIGNDLNAVLDQQGEKQEIDVVRKAQPEREAEEFDVVTHGTEVFAWPQFASAPERAFVVLSTGLPANRLRAGRKHSGGSPHSFESWQLLAVTRRVSYCSGIRSEHNVAFCPHQQSAGL